MTEPPVDAPPPPEASPEDAPRCWRCAAPHDRYQEYCLECGARLVPLATGATWRRETWTRDSPFWFWATFLALLLIALVAGAIVLAATRDDDGAGRPNAAAGPTTSEIAPLTTVPTLPTEGVTTTGLPETVQIPPTTTTGVPTVTTTPPPATPPATPPAPTPPPTPPPAGGGTVIAWPGGKRGYTVILTSVPHGQGRSAAEARAREAIGKGLDKVGVLNSDDYSSLKAGYYVVFTGVHDTESQATSALGSARNAGYPVAYIRRIEP